MTQTEEALLLSIDKSFVEAARIMELADLDENISEQDEDTIYEARHHCGTCQVRTVMEVVWPAIEQYIDWLKQEASGGQNE